MSLARRYPLNLIVLAILSCAGLAAPANAAVTIKVGLASPGPLADPVREAAKEAKEQGIDLFAIATALGPGARLRRGGIDGVGEEDVGRLYLTLGRRPPGEAEEALARLRAIHPGAEIVRHAR
jgi:hypothetical protein